MRNLVRVLVLGMTATGYVAAFISGSPATTARIAASYQMVPAGSPLPECGQDIPCPQSPYIFIGVKP